MQLNYLPGDENFGKIKTLIFSPDLVEEVSLQQEEGLLLVMNML